jgi:hypothetical protein
MEGYKNTIIDDIRSLPILMRYLPTIESYATYYYKYNIDKKNSLQKLLMSIEETNFTFIEIRGNGACLYNSILVSLLLQNKGLTVNHLNTELNEELLTLDNIYNKEIIDNIITNYFVVDSMLESFGKQYLIKEFGLCPNDDSSIDISLYNFTKSLTEPIQNFQQLGLLIANLFNIVIILFDTEINGSITDRLDYVCITPEKCTDINIIKEKLHNNTWDITYIINLSTHYNLLIPYSDNNILLKNEGKIFFNKICNKLRFA